MSILAFAFGFYALLAQVFLFRELAVVFLGHELVFNLALAAWLFWTGMGSARTRRPPIPAAGLDRLAELAVVVLLSVFLIRAAKLAFPEGNLPGIFESVALPLVLLAPACWLSGASFAALSRLKSAASVYAWESAGALTAGLAATFLLVGRVPGLLALSMCGTVLAALTWMRLRSMRTASAVLACAALAIFSGPMDSFTRSLQWRGRSILLQREGRYEHLVLVADQGLNIFFQNGVVSAHFPDPAAAEESVHWPLLAHPKPKHVLALGMGVIPAMAEVLKHPVSQVDVIEPDQEAVAMLSSGLDAGNAKAFSDSRVRVMGVDPREWVRGHPGAYDVIIQPHPEPVNAALNRLFTQEFFEEARQALKPGGLLALSIPSSENYLSPETAYANASVRNALGNAFPQVVLVPGSKMTLLAGTQPIRLDASILAGVYRKRHLTNKALIPENLPFYLDPGRSEYVKMRLAKLGHIAPNQDLRPVAYFLAWRVWLVKFVSPKPWLGLLTLIALGLWGMGRLWTQRDSWMRSPGSMAVWSIGFAGMVLEVALLLGFQIASGALYWRLGLLLAGFMGGLAIGSWMGSRIGSRTRDPRRMLSILPWTGCIGLCLVAWSLPKLVGLSAAQALMVFSCLLALDGMVVGAAYPLACRENPERIYAADLWGAALGAFLAAAFLVPLAGMRATLIVAALFLLVPGTCLVFPGARHQP